MYKGNVIFHEKLPYLLTVDGEMLLFLWKGRMLGPDDLWLRMLNTEVEEVSFMGIRIGDTLNALRRKE